VPMNDILSQISSTSKGIFAGLGSGLGLGSGSGNSSLTGGAGNSEQSSIFDTVMDFAKKGLGNGKDSIEKIQKKPVIEKVKYLYGGDSYMQRYGGDIMKVAFVIFMFILALTYFHIQNNIQLIRKNWPEYKCKPNIMPFAGMINASKDQSAIEYTTQNFLECSTEITKGVYNKPMVMVYAVMDIVVKVFKNAMEVINKIRELFDRIRNALKSIFLLVFNRIMNFVIPLQNLLIKMMDFFEKIKGILATFLLTFMGSLWSLYSLIGSIYELVIYILIVMIVVIVVLWFIPFIGWILAIAAIAVFLTIAIPLIALGIVARQITRQRTSRIPEPD